MVRHFCTFIKIENWGIRFLLIVEQHLIGIELGCCFNVCKSIIQHKMRIPQCLINRRVFRRGG